MGPARRLLALLEQHHTTIFGASLVLAAFLRVQVLLGLSKSVYFRALAPDEDTYHRWAASLADGSATPGFAPDFAKLPALVFSLVYRVTGADPLHLRILNLILGVGVCALVYLCGRALYGGAAGALAACLCAVNKSLVFYSVSVLGTCFGVFLFVLAFWFALTLWFGRESTRVRAALGLCATAGLLVNVRGNAVVVLVAIIPPLYWSLRRREQTLPAELSLERISQIAQRRLSGGTSPLAALRDLEIRRVFQRSRALRSGRSRSEIRHFGFMKCALVFAGACLYLGCAALGGGWRGPEAGFNFYIGNNPDNPSPYFRPVRFTAATPEAQSLGFVVEASRRAGVRLSPSAAERFFAAEVLRAAGRHPVRFLLHLARKLHALVHASPSDNNHDLRVAAEFLPWLGWAFIPSWLVLALGISAVVVLPRDRRLGVGAIACLGYAATVVAFFAGERLRVPLVPIAAVYAAGGLKTAVEDSSRLRGFGGGFVALLAIAHAPLLGANDLSGATNMVALTLLEAGDLDAAERKYERSLAMHGVDSEGARIGLAAILQRRGRVADAIAVLEQLPDAHYEAASKYEWLGNFALAERQPLAAQHAYSASLAIDSSRVNAYKGLYIALRLQGQNAAADEIDRRLHVIESFE